MTATIPSPEELARRIATPTRLGKYLVEGELEAWGPEQTYDVDPWLLAAEQRVIEAILDRKHQRFVRIHVPPQVGKTTFSGLFLLVWLLGMYPNTRIIFITYNDQLAAIRGAEVRDYIKAYGFDLFGIEIDPKHDSASDFRIKGQRGGMLSAGIGSGITGRPGDVIVIDDLIKNVQEAASVATKKLHIGEYVSTIRSRLQPGGTIVFTATRWAEDDLGGWLESRSKEPGYHGDVWESMSFPAIAELPDDISEADMSIGDLEAWRDPLGRRLGEPLQCRFTDPTLPWEDTIFYQIERSTEDKFQFSCLYQQNPTSRTGGMFPPDKWKSFRYAELPTITAMVRVWEPAATAGGGDWSVGVKWGRGADGNYYLLDLQRMQKSSDEVLEDVRIHGRADGYDIPICVEEERAGAGKSVVQFWKVELPEFRVKGLRAEGTKEVRATPYSTLQHGGRTYIPHQDEQVPWRAEFIDQHRKMMGDGRRGRHDDMVDASAYAIIELLGSSEVQMWDPFGSNFDAESQMEGLLMKHLLSR